jgi:hypothetical protein
MQLNGIGTTTATAVVAMIGNCAFQRSWTPISA